MDQKYIEDFRKTHFSQIWNEFYLTTGQSILQRKGEIILQLRNQIEGFIKVILEIQKNIPVQVSTIQLSVLVTSVAANEPVIRFEAFDHRGIVSEHFIAKEETTTWMFTEWEALEQKLEHKVKALELSNFITKEQLWQLKFENMMALICSVAYLFKYDFNKLDQLDGFDQMLIAKPFRFTFGAYRDWQKVLFAKKEEVDIFLQPDQKKLRFHQFHHAVYNNKVIDGREFNHSVFTGCKFRETILKDIDLSDCRFDQCEFDGVIFHNVKARGVIFTNCTINRTQFEEVDFSNGFLVKKDELVDIYQKSNFIECKLWKIVFNKCNMRGVTIQECSSQEVLVDDNTDVQDSTGTKEWRVHP